MWLLDCFGMDDLWTEWLDWDGGREVSGVCIFCQIVVVEYWLSSSGLHDVGLFVTNFSYPLWIHKSS